MAVPLPTGTRWVADLPDGSTTQAGLPTGTRGRRPGRMYIPPPIAASTAEGTLTALASPTTTAAFTATGDLAGTQAPAPVAAFTSEGVYAIPTDRLDADGVATGELAATAAPVTYAAFSASGTLSGIQAPAPAADFTATGEMVIPTSAAIAPLTGEGSLAATAVPTALAQFTASTSTAVTNYPAATAAFTGAGTLSAPLVASSTAPFTSTGSLAATALTFMPSGMNKNGTQGVGTSYALVPNWTADTSGYPGSTVVSDGLRVIGSTTAGKIEVSLVVANSSFSQSATVTLRFYKNGSTLLHTSGGTSIGPNNSGTTVTTSITGQTLADGDVITLQAITTATGSGARTINSGWLRVTQP